MLRELFESVSKLWWGVPTREEINRERSTATAEVAALNAKLAAYERELEAERTKAT